jgi:hypothetical protein
VQDRLAPLRIELSYLLPEEVVDGMITNDKFCCTRWSQLQLSWWRRPLRLRQAAEQADLS